MTTTIPTPKERIAHAVQIASGLLASGHYTEKSSSNYGPDLRYPNAGKGMLAYVVTDALLVVDQITVASVAGVTADGEGAV